MVSDSGHFCSHTDFCDAEPQIGIALDSTAQTTAEHEFYSAHYLRLHDRARLGLLAGNSPAGGDALVELFPSSTPATILVGGQQRLCHAERTDVTGHPLPLPRGLSGFAPDADGKCRVKWVLLTPALWPRIADEDAEGNRVFTKDGRPVILHPGGWLPNWIAAEETNLKGETVPPGGVLLLDGPGKDKARRKRLTPGKRIAARLVAALVPKPVVVTGWALGDASDDPDRPAGAKSTHLAVSAGAVYYFETEGPRAAEDAKALACALNWHGDSDGTAIRNRRSTLCGEKGFGLGVCSEWTFHA